MHSLVNFIQVSTAKNLQSKVGRWERKKSYTTLEIAAMVVVKDGYKICSAVTQNYGPILINHKFSALAMISIGNP